MDTCLPTQDPPGPSRSMQAWFIRPQGLPLSLSLLLFLFHTLSHSLSLQHTHLHSQTTLNLKGHRERKERNGSCHFFSFNWGSAADSVTKPPRGGHQTKGKTFHTLLSFTKESSYLYSDSLTLSSFFKLTYSSSFPFSVASVHVFLYLYFITFDVLTMRFECASLSKIQRGRRGK